MRRLRAPNINKPKFVSGVIIKERPEIKVVSLSGKGDPRYAFDNKLNEIYGWLSDNQCRWLQVRHALGIYYKDRGKVGVEKVEWDACVPTDKKVKTNGKMKFQILPKAEVVSLVLTGDYDLIGPSLEYLEKVAKANNIDISWPLTEIYIKEGKVPVTELQFFTK